MIDVRAWGLPFRIGTTSYILPADLLANAAFLAPQVQDMELVLFAVPGGPSNLPSAPEVAALAGLGRARDLTYTVHLLDDLRLQDADGTPDGVLDGALDGALDGVLSGALARAQQVIDLTRPLAPLAWVCHLDGRSVRQADLRAPQYAAWCAQTATALAQVCAWASDGTRVAVENLEGYPPDFVAPVVARTPAARCLDAGHLWLDGVEPLPHLAAALPRLAVVHLHGVDPQRGVDHCSLAHAVPQQLDAMLRLLLAADYRGVVCLEVFGEQDFRSSLAALEASLRRVRGAEEASRGTPI